VASVVSTAQHVFPLFPDHQAAEAASYSRKIPAVSFFSGSVRGLGPGSEVTMHGLVVGHVTDVRLSYDAAKNTIVAPVRFEVEPERILGVGAKAIFKTPAQAVAAVLRQGLRATLDTASLITGQQEVALDFVPNVPPVPVTMEGTDFVLPTTSGGSFAGLQASATELLNNVNAIPFKQIGDNLDGILRAANGVASDPQMHQALIDLAATLASTKELIGHLDNGMGPAMRQLPEIAGGLQKTLTSANKLVLSLDTGYGDNTQFNRDLERLLAQLTDAVRSIRSLADLLARNPEALIKGRAAGGVE
jgi:paraquat-inducible protein B